MVRTARPCLPYSAATASSVGISATQGAHHVAQRLTSIGLPAKSLSFASLPSGFWKVKPGAGVPACDLSSVLTNAPSPPFAGPAPPPPGYGGQPASGGGGKYCFAP